MKKKNGGPLGSAAPTEKEKAGRLPALQGEDRKRVAQAKKRNKLVKGGKLGRPKKLTPEELRRGVEAYFASISYQVAVTREEDVVLAVDPETGGVTFALDDHGHRIRRIVPVLNAQGKPLMRTVYIEAPGDFGLCNYLKISRDTWERYGRAVELLEARRENEDSPHPSPAATPALEVASCSGAAGATARKSSTGPGPVESPQGEGIGDGGRGGRSVSAPTALDGDDPEMREARDYAEIYTLARGRVCAYLESAAETRGGKGAQFKLERIYGLTEKKDVHVDAGGSIEAYLRGLENEE